MADWNPDAVPDAPPPSRLTADERAVLGALMTAGPNASVREKTAEAGARRAAMEQKDFEATLRKLERMEPCPVHRDRDATTGEEFWIANNEAAELLDPPPDDSAGGR